MISGFQGVRYSWKKSVVQSATMWRFTEKAHGHHTRDSPQKKNGTYHTHQNFHIVFKVCAVYVSPFFLSPFNHSTHKRQGYILFSRIERVSMLMQSIRLNMLASMRERRRSHENYIGYVLEHHRGVSSHSP